MTVAFEWLDDQQMTELGQLVPSTAFGCELMAQWPARYPSQNSTSAYRGYATALWTLVRNVNRQSCTTGSIIALIDSVTQTLTETQPSRVEGPPLSLSETIRSFVDATSLPLLETDHDRRMMSFGAARVALLNSRERAQVIGIEPGDLVALYESEAMYAARKFCQARDSRDGFA